MARLLKPRIVQDIQSAGGSIFRFRVERINLHGGRRFRISPVGIARSAIAVLAGFSLIFGSVAAPTTPTLAASPVNENERQALEAELQKLEREIDQYEDQVVGYQTQGKTLKNEISRLNDRIAKLNLQIQAINLTLSQLDKRIVETQFQIDATDASIESHKQTLSRLIRNLYESEQDSLMEIFLKNPRLSDFFTDVNNIASLQNNLRVTIEEITDLYEELKDNQEQFHLARADAASVKIYQDAQKQEVEGVKGEKNKLLDITKGQESRYQALLQETKKTATQIRSQIFELLGGGELTFEQAYAYAKLAGGATGIRPAMILAVLDRESALGQNVGKCSYKTAMSPSNRPIFLEITRKLNINPDIVTVSCPNRDGVYGGAMGPAQFIPSTWKLYETQVAKVTGNSPASPWNNSDAFVATALYLSDALAGCKSVYSLQSSQERCAAAKYYAGGRWRSYLWTYGEAVVSRAQRFQQDINTITG
ncbi:hypothetical protein C4587_00200 [Candidatus Parcubacteria bacterium]|nr:MAG: hypothetical protein C4587_00200 [Candidatus Parcubacteria bacterium]